jgi:hypothetical protein
MSEKKEATLLRIWERLNPFQSSTRFGATLREAIFPHADEVNQRPDIVTSSESGWTIVEEKREPQLAPYLQNGFAKAETAFAENSISRPARTKKSLPFKRAVRLKPATLSDDRFQVLQKWEGTVLEMDAAALFARLKDLTHDNPDEEVEIEFEEILPDDLPLVQPGASFYWSIGYLHKSHGQRIRASEIRFRRIPGWTDDEILNAENQVAVDESFYNLDCGKSCA